MARTRDYDKEYRASRRPDRRRANIMRKRARRKMEKRFGSLAIKGKDIDHKNFNTSNNSWSNLSIMSRKANRSKQPKRK